MYSQQPTTTSPPMPPPPPLPPQQRRKGAGIRAWLVVSVSGNSHLEEVGKHLIMRRTGLPARDLRILDPGLSYPSTILGRERAIVVNLEHIKAIITATEVWVPNSKDPWVAPFVRDLESRVSNLNEETRRATEESGSPEFPRSTSESPEGEMLQTNGTGSPMACGDMQIKGAPKALPFEFQVIEVCFESVCRSLEAEVRDEIENLLDDDMDMAEMYLTDKLSDFQCQEDELKDEIEKDNDSYKLDYESDEDSQDNKSSSEKVTGFKPNVEELEMLLEAYFAQIGRTLNKLSALREYVDDTEDYINIMLDDKQNQLLQMGVLLSTATLLLNASIVVVGLFGMNIHISLFDAGHAEFWETTFGTMAGSVALYFIAFYLGKKKGLLE
ncbi:magnesium transporter MRS2-F-like isoform X2 [Macadamia integrifolia]|uniref:magnesium transporter MRS2-F-like isoform X2 n=1 Tax=Macadamia integrifolia TaxID=60698 RepID=UPI001C4E704C|nr:magnesium transporter MRS2-F-like isoform X2 [Macadamia integrifolia]